MTLRRILPICFGAVLLAGLLAGCPGDPEVDGGMPDVPAAIDAALDVPDGIDDDAPARDGGEDDGGIDDGGTDGGTDAGVTGCGDVASRPVVTVSADITADTTWTCNNIYELDQIRYVAGAGAMVPTLTIEAGTLIRGEPPVYVIPGDPGSGIAELPGALVITRQGRLVAEGTATAPIVFTSASAAGSRLPGDWGGLVLLGRADNNTATGELRLEGLPLSAGMRGFHGAAPGMADPTWNCGSLRYVRVEFAGFVLADARELNGITLGGCGTDTELSFVQVHMGSDDGIEFFGGAPNVDHLVVTGAQDDGVDWDLGFRGRLQFVAIQQYPMSVTGVNPDKGIEANNNTDLDPVDLTPISEPRIFNMTMIGLGEAAGGQGIHFRDGTFGFVANTLVTGFNGGAVDVDDAATITAAISMGGLDRLVFRNSIVEQSVLAPPSGAFWTSDTDGIVESTHFTMGPLSNRETTTGTPPTVLPDPFARLAPGWVPAAGSAPAAGAIAPGEAPDTTCTPDCAGTDICRFGACIAPFFDATATYVGAFMPGGTDWTTGWISTAPN